uniref:Uncharacterized protein n=1 Tax=Romanomermis culicivorax TaxID=13658 RepID=A0A915KTW3_ROMCU
MYSRIAVRREIDVWNRMWHPNLPALHDAIEFDQSAWLIYEKYLCNRSRIGWSESATKTLVRKRNT